MPTLPIRQRLLQGAFKYARKLQDLRRRATEESDSSGSSDVVQWSQLSLSSDSVLHVDFAYCVSSYS
jgi:hypothetical protein